MYFKTIGTGSSGNCYLIRTWKDKGILLDCGLPYKQILPEIDFVLPDALIISHNHGDHTKALKDFQKAGVPVNSCPHCKMFLLNHDEQCWGSLFKYFDKKFCYITDTAFVHNTFKGVHAFIVECNYIEELLAANEDYSENLKARIRKNHMELETCKKFLQVNIDESTEHIVLIHLSDSNSDEKRMQREIQELFPLQKVSVAKKGMRLEI